MACGCCRRGSSGLSGGAIAGIVIGVLVGLAAAAAVAWLLLRRRREPRMPAMNGGTFSMPGFGDGEFGRSVSWTHSSTCHAVNGEWHALA